MKCSILISMYLFLNIKAYSQVTTPSYCLVNQNNEVSEGCLGTKLSFDSINRFAEAYPETTQGISLIGPKGPTFTPLVAQSTSLTPNQMVPPYIMSQWKLKAPPNVLNWSIMPKVVIFGGSQSEGQVLIPSRGWIKTAHRNKSLVLGCIFLPPDVYGGDKLSTQINWLLNPDSDVAKQLVLLLKTYGFDGYFINAESSTASEKSRDFGQLMRKMKDLAEEEHIPIHLEWYVVGNIDITDDLISKNGQCNSDSAFIDHFIWSDFRSKWSQLLPHMQSTYNPYRVEYGAYNEDELKSLLEINKDFKSSISYFTYNGIVLPSTTNYLMTPEAEDQKTLEFWGKYSTSFLNDTTRKIYNLPFVTNFSTGRGKDFYINGNSMAFGPWNSMELQSDLPLIDWKNPLIYF